MRYPLTLIIALLIVAIVGYLGFFYLVARYKSVEYFYYTINPNPTKTRYWTKYDPDSTATIDNHLWGVFLKKYVITGPSGVNLVNYAKVTPGSRVNLHNYIRYLENIKISKYNVDAQEAYWVNLYNAATVSLVLRYYPVKSIRNISKLPFIPIGPWNWKVARVEGHELSLNDIEFRILRAIWQDPRIHYALNCAAYTCPNLLKIPFTAANVDALLTHAAKQYINNFRGVRIVGNKLTVSKLYEWYQADFGGSEKAVLAHLKRYAAPALKDKLDHFNHISAYQYNWALNDVKFAHPTTINPQAQ